MASDHDMSRFLTAPWEVGQRRLHCYDFASGVFSDPSSESPLVQGGPGSGDAGDAFSALVESPAGAYRAEILRGGTSGNSSGDWKVYRALVALVWLQVSRDPRGGSGMPPDNPFTIDGLRAQGEPLLDVAGRLSVDRYPLIGVALPASVAPLCFTEVGYFSIPIVGGAPLLAVPFTPRYFVATPEKGFPPDTLNQWLQHPIALSAFSMGTEAVNRVVIPPELSAPGGTNPIGLQRMLHEQRKNAEDLLDLVDEANRLVGFRR